jgi:hypothetical protein
VTVVRILKVCVFLQIEILGHVETIDKASDSYILIDKVAVVVAAVGTSRSFIYSLMPDHWCQL